MWPTPSIVVKWKRTLVNPNHGKRPDLNLGTLCRIGLALHRNPKFGRLHHEPSLNAQELIPCLGVRISR